MNKKPTEAMNRPRKVRFKSSTLKFVAVTLSSLLVILIIELATRVVVWMNEGVPVFARNPHPRLDLYMQHPYLLSVPRPNGSWGYYEVNSLGYRGPEFNYSKPSNTFRVVALGGSTTWGYAVDNAHTYPRELERALNHDGSARFEVINAGMPGHNSAENLIKLHLRVLDLEPDMIIIYQAYNDLKANGPNGCQRDYSHYRLRRGKVGVPFLQRHWRLAYALFTIDRLNALRRALPLKKTKFDRLDDVSDDCVLAFKENLRNMIHLARSHGVEVVLCTYARSLTTDNLANHPDQFKPLWSHVPHLSYAGMMRGFERYNTAIIELGLEEEVAVVHQDQLMPPDFDHFYDHVHFTAKGTRRFAGNLADHILESRP